MTEPKYLSGGKPGHSHRWHTFQLKNAFEPFRIPDGLIERLGDEDIILLENLNLHTMTEYAYSACMCGAVIKSKVEDNPNEVPDE